jgi:hypothetical protein
MSAQHTRGPWGLAEAINVWVMAGPLHVASIPRAGDGDWSKANARLIAAAPDLLAALTFIVEQAGNPANAHHTLGAWAHGEGMQMAQDAIAKAEGAA